MSSISREKLAPCLSVTDWGMSSGAGLLNAYPISSEKIKVQHYTLLTNQRPALHSSDQSETSTALLRPIRGLCIVAVGDIVWPGDGTPPAVKGARDADLTQHHLPIPLDIWLFFYLIYFIFYGVFNVELCETEKNVHKFKHHSLNKSISCLHSRAIQTVSTMRNLQQIEI